MPYYKFEDADILHNRIETHPKKEFFVYNSKIYLDNQSQISGAFTGSVPNVPPGYANLYELNVDRTSSVTGRSIGAVDDTGLIFPFIVKNGSLSSFRTVTTASFNQDFSYGDILSSSYPLSASVARQYFTTSTTRKNSANRINALKTALDYNSYLSRQYTFSSSYGDKETQAINLISVPSIFYGSSIKKGSVDLKFYITGTLIGELKDENFNGELIQTGPPGSNQSGSTAGVVLYNEGFLLLTGSWTLGEGTHNYLNDGSPVNSSWLFYGVGANDGIPADASAGATSRISASCNLQFKGTNHVPVITMMAHARRGELNYSNNPTFINQGESTAFSFRSGSAGYAESANQPIKNTVKTGYTSPTGSYAPQTFISRVGIFDKDKNLIGIAKVATPVKKTEERDLAFKLKLDF
tara:strand:- start:1172 stop:2401 length:1230 start_codon:yes stop_codon:yes gene_type:complete